MWFGGGYQDELVDPPVQRIELARSHVFPPLPQDTRHVE
jgi:hypothetical protein